MNPNEITEFENLISLENPINSKIVPRWERKANQQSHLSLSSDRYIPNRSNMEYDVKMGGHNDENICNEGGNTSNSNFAKLLVANTLQCDGKSVRVLSFKNKAPNPCVEHQNALKILYTQNLTKKDVFKPIRHISSAPFRILDAPDMLDDYYLNLLSWNSANVLAVALSQCVYTWDAASGGIKELMNVDSDSTDYISSVAWVQQGGNHIAIGTANQNVQLWDVQASRQVRSLGGHSARVGALAWNGHLLASGSKDNTIITHDVRVQNHIVGKMTRHTQEVCGLAWSPDGTFLASGANDNTLCITDATQMTASSMDATPRYILTDHQAAVKALAWSPHERNLLATGGGTADRSIKFWNAGCGTLLNSVDTGSQVCALQWSPHEKELLSRLMNHSFSFPSKFHLVHCQHSHGYAENQLCLWKYPSMVRMKEFKGHSSRVLHLASSPDGSIVCSGAADETLRFWNIFGCDNKKQQKQDSTASFGNHSQVGGSGGISKLNIR